VLAEEGLMVDRRFPAPSVPSCRERQNHAEESVCGYTFRHRVFIGFLGKRRVPIKVLSLVLIVVGNGVVLQVFEALVYF
jgi:hypothetical protein